jgi:OmpA-OmpF porin, OOP family
MRREFFKLIPLLFLITPAFSQESDSLIYAEGNIISAETKEPVKARITYQSEPYGNMVGVINNTTYSFPMFELEKYSIVVEAPGYQLAKYLLDPAEAKGDRKLVRNIELSKGNYVTGQRVAVGNVIRLENLIFQVGRTKISPESYEELNVVAKMMQDNSNMVIQLEGHTDYQGDSKENLKLSQGRVDAVKSYLVSQGIQKNRIKTKAFGGSQPLSREDAPEAHRLNRRVELRILEN